MAQVACLALALSAGVGCGGPAEPGPTSCGTPVPAFVLSLNYPEHDVPSDLAVTATYGAGEETYRVASPSAPSEVLFCAVEGEDAAGGASGIPRDATLRCELWSDSSVIVRVTSARYAVLEVELKPTVDRCGVVTTELELSLEAPPVE